MYLSGVSRQSLTDLHRPDIGLMLQPGNSYHRQIDRYPFFAVDNGAFGGKFDPDRWLRLLDHAASWGDRCLFAVCPDRFDPTDLAGNHPATLDLWKEWVHEVTDRDLRPAFVCQNGCTPDDVPGDAACAFIGGDTAWKLSEQAWAVVASTKAHGRWAHVGRVNSMKRLRACSLSGADSADGTFIKYGPDIRLPELCGWLDQLNAQPHLALFGGAA